MGLDAFLIPMDPLPEAPPPRLDDLAEALLEPVLAAAEGPKTTEETPKPPTPAAPWSLTAALANQAATTALADFLTPRAIADPAPATAVPRGLLDDDTVLGPADLAPTPPPAAPPTASPSLVANEAPDSPPSTFAALFTRSSPTPPGSPSFSARGVAADHDGDAFERIEGRLAQVAERLEQAVERMAVSGPTAIGSRPRTFRGRLDG